MTGHRLTKLSVAIGLSIATSSTLASPQSFMSARSFAMGGTGVAVATPSTAPSDNPAMMAADHHSWQDDFGLMLPSVNARAADEEETVDQVDDIQDVITDLESLVSGFDPNNDNPDAIQAGAADLSNRLTEFDRDTMRVNAGLGMALAVPGQSLSVGVFTNGNLTATVRGDVSDQDITALDNIASAATAQDVQDAVDQISTNGTLDLTSQGQILASAVGEVGISFARSFELQNGNSFQLGLSPKYVELRTFQYTESVSGFEDDEFDDDQYQTEKSGFNVDVGAAYSSVTPTSGTQVLLLKT